MKGSSKKRQPISFRFSQEVMDVINKAREITGQSRTEFVRMAAMKAARGIADKER